METYSIKENKSISNIKNKKRRPFTALFLIIIYIISALAITYWITPLVDTFEFVKLLPPKCINDECKSKYELKINKINRKLNDYDWFYTSKQCISVTKDYLYNIRDICKSNVCQCSNSNSNSNEEKHNCWSCINPKLINVCENIDNIIDEVDKKCSIKDSNDTYTYYYYL